MKAKQKRKQKNETNFNSSNYSLENFVELVP